MQRNDIDKYWIFFEYWKFPQYTIFLMRYNASIGNRYFK